jgi:type I restriction-modification system DNA methylase subunit
MTKEEAKLKIAELVEKYQKLTPKEIKGFNEAATKQGFIEPLFRALGWDFENTNEVSPEENASNGRVDYAFKLNNVSQFYVEAKPLKADLNREDYVKQAVSYSYARGVTWAILTDFESIRFFNALQNKPFISLSCIDYITKFDDIWLLSKTATITDELNKQAREYGAMPPFIPIEKRLFKQLSLWRESLFNEIYRYNEDKKLQREQVDSMIQKLFNRLIFMRTAEDRKIEENGLRALLNQWKTGGSKGYLIKPLRALFVEYEGYYDSELFSHHLLDEDIFIDNESLQSVLEGLYEIPGSLASYNFNDIDADVLGAVYEQYLGHIAEVVKQQVQKAQAKMALGIETTTFTMTDKKERRKEHGIYYTPKIITDYIVKETVGKYLQENAGYPDKLLNVKILDPACGSGSFLIRAYDELLKNRASILGKPVDKLDQWERLPVLTNSIFGVDLDKQAVEVARLNLLLRSLAHREPLPYLGNNIKNGNSLISGTDEELEKYFGAEWEKQRPFNWQDEFSGVMEKGGFDIVIGNPPYIRQEQLSQFKPLWQKEFECYNGAADIYIYFFERGLQLLREGGYLAYISPNKYFRSGYGKKLREYLTTKTTIEQIIDFGDAPVFDAITYPSIIVLRKIPTSQNQTRIFTWNPTEHLEKFSSVVASDSSTISQEELTAAGWHLESKSSLSLLAKLRKAGKPLGEYVNERFYYGIKTGLNDAFVVNKQVRDNLLVEDASSSKLLKPLLRGKDIKRWGVSFGEQYLIKIESSENATHPWSGKSVVEAENIFANTYPAVFKWLNSSRKDLIDRADQGKYFWELRSCKYWHEFDQPNIVWGNLAVEPKFGFTQVGFCVSAPASILVSNSKYLLGILNSRVTQYLVSQSAAERQGGYLEYKPMYISPLAIPEQPKDEKISSIVDKILIAKSKDPLADVTKLERQIDLLVYQLYKLTPEEIKIIEGETGD